MVRTLPPFSQLIDAERRRWAPFRRALPKADQVIFDKLFDCAKLHVQAGVMVSRPWPFETIVMAVLLEHQRRIEEVVRRIEELKGGTRTKSVKFHTPPDLVVEPRHLRHSLEIVQSYPHPGPSAATTI
jgi:hypothetical protein